ncbi:MAG: substrate-binding domain-containing protein [Candidatus Puniceispirillaceae bacterium]
MTGFFLPDRTPSASWVAGIMLWFAVLPAMASEAIIVQSTTSTQNSGLYDYLLPLYQQQTANQVHVVAVGTGQAIKNAKNCDGDVLLVHSKADEEQFVASGFGVRRYDVMYNDFVILGPDEDPADIASASNIKQALARIAASQNRFISRGDDSGTHKAELRFWRGAEIAPAQQMGQYYLEAGQGMGATLNMAVQLGGYVISDRATWLAFGNRQNHNILFEGDRALYNQYGVTMVNPDKCPSTATELARIFVDWLISEAGQAAINSYNVNGQQLFFANAK